MDSDLPLSSLSSQRSSRQTGFLNLVAPSQLFSHATPHFKHSTELLDSQVAILDYVNPERPEEDISNISFRGFLFESLETHQNASKAWTQVPHGCPSSSDFDSSTHPSPAPSQPTSPLGLTVSLPFSQVAPEDPPPLLYQPSQGWDSTEPNMTIKKRRSLQPLFIPPFLRPPSPEDAYSSRQRSHSAAALTFASSIATPYLAIPPAIPINPDDKASQEDTPLPTPFTSPRNSPPSDLLDDDPFANLSPGPSVITPESSFTARRYRSASLPRLRTSVDVGQNLFTPPQSTPRSPLAQGALLTEDGARSLSKATGSNLGSPENSLPSTPPLTPQLVGQRAGLLSPVKDRVRSAYTRPAFKPRPSLPSLRTLERAQTFVQPKVRRGRVGATLPFEPWESQSSDISRSSENSETEPLTDSVSSSVNSPSLSTPTTPSLPTVPKPLPVVPGQTPTRPSHSRRPSGLETIRDSRLIPDDVDEQRISFSSLASLSSKDRESIDAQTLLDAGFLADQQIALSSGESSSEAISEPILDSLPTIAAGLEIVEPSQGVRPSRHLRRPSGLTTIRDSRLISPESETRDDVLFTESPIEVIPLTSSPSDGALPSSTDSDFSTPVLLRSHSEPNPVTPSLFPAQLDVVSSNILHHDIGNPEVLPSPSELTAHSSVSSTSPSTATFPPSPTFSSDLPLDSTTSTSMSSDPLSHSHLDRLHPSFMSSATPFTRGSLFDDLADTMEYDYADVISRLGSSPTASIVGYSRAHDQHDGIVEIEDDQFEPGTSADTIRRLSSYRNSTEHCSHSQSSQRSSTSNLTLELEWTPSSSLGLPLSPSSMTTMTTTTESSDGQMSYEPSSSDSSDGYGTDSFLSFDSDDSGEDSKSTYGSAIQSPTLSRSVSDSTSLPTSQMVTPPIFEDDLDLDLAKEKEEPSKTDDTQMPTAGNEEPTEKPSAISHLEHTGFHGSDRHSESPFQSATSSPLSSPALSRANSKRSSNRILSKSASIQNSLRQLFRRASNASKPEVSEPLIPEASSSSQTLEMLVRQGSVRSRHGDETMDSTGGYRRQRSGTFQSSASGSGYNGDGRYGSSASFRGSSGIGGSGGSGGRRGQDDDDDRWNRRLPPSSAAQFDTDSESSEEEDETDEYGERSPISKHPLRAKESAPSSDDDVPLAQQIPGALKAQKTIRRQVRDEFGKKRLERKATAAARREIPSPVPASAVSIAFDQRTSSAPQPQPSQQPSKPFSRLRTKTLPSKSSSPFSISDLTTKLLTVQVGQGPSSRRPSEEVPRRLSRDRSQEPPSLPRSPHPPQENSSAPVMRSQTMSSRSLRPQRSFHRPHTAEQDAHVPAPPPLPSDPMSNLGRSATTATRRAHDYNHHSYQPLASPALRSADLDTEFQARAHSRRPSVDRDISQPPVSLDRARSTRAHSRRPSVDARDDPRGVTLDRARSTRSHSRRPSVDDDGRRSQSRPPPMPPLYSSEVVPPVPKPVQMWQQRIFVNNLQSFNQIEVHAGTTAGDVLRILESQRALPGGGTSWMLWEVCQDFGMERPIRSFELLTDVTTSWNTEKTVNVFLAKETDLQPRLSRAAMPTSSPIFIGSVQHEYKRGKWQKRYIELREHSLWLSKKDNGKDQVNLCSVSNFDAYFVTRPTKAPKPFVFAIKSTDNLSFFENTADYMHTFACETKDGRALIEKILLARSYVLYQERNVLTNTSVSAPVAGGASLSRAGTRKGQRPAQPLVNLGGHAVAVVPDVPPVPAMFEPGSLLAKRGI